MKYDLDSMHKYAGDSSVTKNEKGEFLLRVDGGATVNNLLMQIQVGFSTFNLLIKLHHLSITHGFQTFVLLSTL